MLEPLDSVTNKQSAPSSSNAVTILDALKTPRLSDLTRKRKVDCNPPPRGKRRAVMSVFTGKFVTFLFGIKGFLLE